VQRQAIDRQRTIGTFQIIIGVVFLCLVGALTVTRSSTGTVLLEALVGISMTISGLVHRRDARRKQSAFEAKEGADAGKQRPVT
jgi:uncharacterized membrane protein HdeD (DUF308 family)